MSESESSQSLAYGVDIGSSLMEISRIHKTNDSYAMKIVENAIGKKTTPVLIAFDKDKSYIGEVANNNKIRCSPNYFTDINEMIAENEARTFPYLQTSENPSLLHKPNTENTFIQDVRAKGLPVPPSDVDNENSNSKSFADLVQSSYASSSIDDLSSGVLGGGNNDNCNECVLAVAPYLNDKHVKNLLRLYKKFQSRYHIKVDTVIPDYEALAICYGYENTITSTTEQIYLIVDMGYSHTSATVVQYTSNQCNILSSCYTRKICGKKIDNLMAESIAKEVYLEGNPVNEQMAVDSIDTPNTPIFKDTATVGTSMTPTPKPDIENNNNNNESDKNISYMNKFEDKLKTKIMITMEEIKKKLSAQGADTITVSIEGGLPDDGDYEGIYSKEILDNLLTNNHYPEMLIGLIKRAIKESNIGEETTIEGVIISGGSMRIPLLQETIKKDLKLNLIQTLNMDESVAHGCSAYWLNIHGLWNNYSIIGKLRDKSKEDELEDEDDETRQGLDRVSNCINIDEEDHSILSPEMLDKNQLSSIETRINEILEFESKKNEIAAAKNKVEEKIYQQMLRTEFHEKILDFMKKPMSGYLPLKFYTELEDYIERGKEISLERLLEEVTNRPLPPMDELVNDCYIQLINDQYNKLNNIKINLPSAMFIPSGEDGSDSLPKPYPALNRQEFDDLITKVRKSEIIFEDTMEKIRKSRVNTPMTGKDSEEEENNNNNDDDEDKSPLSRNMTKAELDSNDEDVYHRNENGELVDEDGNVIDESKYHLNEDGELEDEEGNIVDKDGKIIRKKGEKKIKRNKEGELEDEDGNIVDDEGNIIKKKKENLGKHKRNEKGELVDENGNVIDESKYHLNEDGVLVDKDGNEVDGNGNKIGRQKIIDENGNILDPTKYRYNDSHEILDNDGNVVDEYGDIIRKAMEGKYHRNEDGKLVDENGNVIDETKFRLNENGELEDKDGNVVNENGKIVKRKEKLGKFQRNENGELVDENGNVVDESKYRLNENGELVDKDGNIVDSDGNILRKAKEGKYHRNKQGQLVDEDGNVIDESKYRLNENGLLEDKNGNIVDKDGNILVTAEDIRDKGINAALSGLNWDLWGSTLEPEPQLQPWPLMPQKPSTAPELSPHSAGKKCQRNDPIQYLLKMQPSPALLEFLKQPNCHITIDNLKLFRKTTPLTPVSPERMKSNRPIRSSFSPCSSSRLFYSGKGTTSLKMTQSFRRTSNHYNSHHNDEDGSNNSSYKISLSNPQTPMNNTITNSVIPNNISFDESLSSAAPLDDRMNNSTLNYTSSSNNNYDDSNYVNEGDVDEYDDEGNLMFKRDETVEYYEEYNRSWIRARFATEVDRNYVEIVNHETGKKNVQRNHVRKYKPAKYEPGQIVHFIKPYSDILMKRLGENEAEVLKESNGKYCIKIKGTKYREVNALVFE